MLCRNWMLSNKEREREIADALRSSYNSPLCLVLFYYYFIIALWCCGDCSSGLIGNQINQESPCGHFEALFEYLETDWPQKWAALSVYCRHPTGICFRSSEVFSRCEKFPLDSLLPTTDLLIRAVLISGPSLFQLCSLHPLVMFMIRLE